MLSKIFYDLRPFMAVFLLMILTFTCMALVLDVVFDEENFDEIPKIF